MIWHAQPSLNFGSSEGYSQIKYRSIYKGAANIFVPAQYKKIYVTDQMLASSYIAGFFDHQYLQKELTNLLEFFYAEMVTQEMINQKVMRLDGCG